MEIQFWLFLKIWSYQFVGDFQVQSTSFCDRALLDFVFHCYVRMGVNIYVADLVPCRFEALVAGNIFSAAQSLVITNSTAIALFSPYILWSCFVLQELAIWFVLQFSAYMFFVCEGL